MRGKFHHGLVLALVLVLSACSPRAELQRTLRQVGPEPLRREALAACGDAFNAARPVQISNDRVPASVRAFKPIGLWAESDGAYVLMESDAAGERGVFIPRILSEKDPICGPKLTHEKLAEGVYWYEKKR